MINLSVPLHAPGEPQRFLYQGRPDLYFTCDAASGCSARRVVPAPAKLDNVELPEGWSTYLGGVRCPNHRGAR